MRKQMGVIGVTLVGALLALPAAVAAQDASCTGEVTLSEQSDGTVHVWSADDPRLSGEVTIEEGWSFYPVASEVRGETDDPADYEITNPEGSWRCIFSVPAGPEPDLDGHSLVFMGDGAYEGLHAFVAVDWAEGSSAFSGFITSEEVPDDPTLEG